MQVVQSHHHGLVGVQPFYRLVGDVDAMENTSSMLAYILFDSPTSCLTSRSLTFCSGVRESGLPGPESSILMVDTASCIRGSRDFMASRGRTVARRSASPCPSRFHVLLPDVLAQLLELRADVFLPDQRRVFSRSSLLTTGTKTEHRFAAPQKTIDGKDIGGRIVGQDPCGIGPKTPACMLRLNLSHTRARCFILK